MKKRIASIALIISMIFPLVSFADENLVEVCGNKPAEASSNLSAEYTADKANDGINDNAEYTAWVSADADALPYWQADFCMAYKISKIELESRIDGDAEERKNFRVLLSNDPEFSEYEIAGEASDDYGNKNIWSVNIDNRNRYQYIRVEKTAEGSLSIGEIRVYVKDSTLLYGTEVNEKNSQQPMTDEETRYSLPNDIIGTNIEKEVRFLSILNIMRGYPDGNFLKDECITRAEFASVAVKLTGDTMHTTENTFSDVTNEHWAYDAIEICAQRGLINGIEDNIFAPDEIITYEQAIKIIVTALGYSDIAQQSGGYPSGYLGIAYNLNLMSKLNNVSEQITRGDIAQIVYNALFAKMPNIQYNNSSGSMFDEDEDTILERVFGLQKVKGLVTEITGMSLTNEELKRENYAYITVNDVRYLTDDPNYRNYFGKIVEVYYKKDYSDDEQTATVIVPSSKTVTFEIDADDALEFNNRNELVYESENSKQRKIEFRADLDVIYNNKPFINYNRSELLPENGSIQAIDYDGDGKYDIMIIRAVKTYVVNWVNATENIIYPKPIKESKVESINLDENIYEFKVYNIEGEEITLSDLKEWNVLSIEESANTNGDKSIAIYVSDAFVRGQISGMHDEFVKIKNKEYELADTLDKSELNVRDSGVFYLDCYGRVAAFDASSSSDGKYGFVIRVYDIAGSDDTVFRIYTSSGAFKDFTAASKLKIDKTPAKGEQQIKNLLLRSCVSYDDQSGYDFRQLIRYTINSKNEITSINTTYRNTDAETEEENLTKDFDDDVNRYRRAGDSVFGMVVRPTDNAVMMSIPEDLSREDEYAILSLSSFAGDKDHKFEAYDCGKMNDAKAIVQFAGTQEAVKETAPFFIVDKVVQGMNKDDIAVDILCGFTNGQYVEYPERDAGIISTLGLKKGDIIALSLTASNEIKQIEKRFYVGDLPSDRPVNSISTNTPMGPQENWRTPYTNLFLAYGEVICKDGSYIKIEIDTTNCKHLTYADNYKVLIANLDNSSTKKYIYDSAAGKDGEVRIATNEDFIDAESASEGVKVVMKIGSGLIGDIVILK